MFIGLEYLVDVAAFTRDITLFVSSYASLLIVLLIFHEWRDIILQPNDQSTFSSWLLAQLRHRGMTAKQLASEIGISEASLSRLKSGKSILTPQMRGRLATAFNVAAHAIPEVSAGQSDSVLEPHPTVLTILRTSFPDHAVINVAADMGIFAQQGLHVEQCHHPDIPADYPKSYRQRIQSHVHEGRVVLVVGPSVAAVGDSVSSARISRLDLPSHLFNGFAIVARADSDVPSIHCGSNGNELLQLKSMLERLLDADLWCDAKGYRRIAWMSDMEFNLLECIWGLAKEVVCGEKFLSARKPMKHPSVKGLRGLHGLGKRGVDLVLSDVSSAAVALSQPDKYKIILSLSDLQRVVANISEEDPPVWASLLRPLYHADRSTVAMQRFQEHWARVFAEAEVPMKWQLFYPSGTDETLLEELVCRLKRTRQEIELQLSCPIKRLAIQRHVFDQTICTASATLDAFCSEWATSFKGL